MYCLSKFVMVIRALEEGLNERCFSWVLDEDVNLIGILKHINGTILNGLLGPTRIANNPVHTSRAKIMRSKSDLIINKIQTT